MKIKTILIFPLVLIIIFGGIAVADGFGIWQTESSKVPMTIKDGEFAGEYDPADIRGSYSFLDIELAFGVPSDIIAKAFGLTSDNPGDIKAKDLEAIYGETNNGLEVGTGSIRTFIAYYIGMDYESDDGIPQQAVDILREEGKWSSELDTLYEGKIIDLSQFDKNLVIENQVNTKEDSSEVELNGESMEAELSESTSVNNESEEHDDDEQLVKGKTTVADIISWGISLETIESILTVNVENENMLIRDICTQNELAFSDVKAALNELLEP